MMKILAASLLLAVGAPAMAQAPADPYQAGVAARLAGDPQRAADLLSGVVAEQPDNADAQLQLGLALLQLGRLDEAEAAFRRTLAIAPDYADARIGLARVAQRRGDLKSALAELQPIDPANVEAADLRSLLSPADQATRYKWRIDVDGSYTWLDGPQQDWKEGTTRLSHIVSPGTEISGAVQVARRFGEKDIYGELRLDRRVSPGTSFYVRAGATPNDDFLPEYEIAGGAEFRLAPGPTATVLVAEAFHARYNTGDIQTLRPGVDQYMAGGRVWLSARWINILENGDHSGGWLGRATYQPTDKLRMFVGAADAPDIENGFVVDTQSVFGGLSYDLSDQMNLRGSLSHDDVDTGADRTQASLGVGWRF